MEFAESAVNGYIGIDVHKMVQTAEGFVETLAWKHIDLDGSNIHNRDLVDFVLN